MTQTGHRSAARPGGRGLMLALVIGVWLTADALAAERSRTGSGSTQASSGEEALAQGEAKLAARLDQILANQEKIFQRFDEVLEELKIVKIRATLR